MFHTEAKKKEVDRNKDTKKGMIEGKEGKPYDHIDLRAECDISSRDFSQLFESIGLGLKNFGLEKKSRYRSR